MDTSLSYVAIQGLQQNVGYFNTAINPNGGNVGIGTTNPQQLLDVAGTMSAKEIVVTQTGADYVFDPAYRLAPLSEVADYIRENHHLPDVPSARKCGRRASASVKCKPSSLPKSRSSPCT